MGLFERFYTKEVEIYSMREEGVYTRERVFTPLCTIMADVQPYIAGETSRNELGDLMFGLMEQYKLRLFAADNENIKVGNYVLYDGSYYRIEHVSGWELGTEAVLSER